VLLVGGIVMILPQPRTSGEAYAVDNPGPSGARAAAQILQRQGVSITTVHSLDDALARAKAGDTLAVLGDRYLTDRERLLEESEADLLLVAFDWYPASTDVGIAYGASVTSTVAAGCSDPDAQAAGTITTRRWLRVPPDTDATVCFPRPDDTYWYGERTGAYVVTERDGRRVAMLADATPLLNGALAEEGNAALALRALGKNERLVWFLPRAQASEGTADIDMWDTMPLAVPILFLHGLVVAVVAALWRGRRLGPVVTERLPVVVPAAEASRGRARLYRKMRSHGRAAAALRAGAALRLGTRLGLPRSAPAPDLIDAVARASGRPPDMVESLLFGPPPPDDPHLIRLAQELDHLESEVHHP